VELRHQRCTLRRIARLLLVPISTLARAMRRLGLNRLRNLDPKPPVQRYQWERPGDMIHVDIKQLARFHRVGHRITGDRRQGCSPGAGYEKVHVAIDDATRLSYVEVLPDEKGPTTVGFLSRAVAWFNGQGIECRRVLSDNGSAYKSHGWRKACQAMGLKVKKTRPYTPRTNGKAERFIKTLLEEWAYVMPYGNSAARNELLPAYLRIYNSRRCHMALGGLTPQQRLAQLQA
jgi:transposase InsO family protein